ncbi:MAG: YraN family protein [Clostridia bacterium]|nr:YraN family protein [Clostridia bacterium]
MKILEILTPRRLLGNFGERAAVKYLKKHGYRILERNFVAENLEIDIIAHDGDKTVFVEVKTRAYRQSTPTTYRAASAVTREKQRKIIECARIYRSHKFDGGRVRFDVIEVYTEGELPHCRVKEINHIKAAFDKNSAYSR